MPDAPTPIEAARARAEKEFACVVSSGSSDDFDALPGDYHITFDAIWNIACDAERATLRNKVEAMDRFSEEAGNGLVPDEWSGDWIQRAAVLAALSGDGT